jgi:hypothetical protein
MLLVVCHEFLVYGKVDTLHLRFVNCCANDLCRRGVPFTAMWLKFGNYDAQYDVDYINETANTASSIYFVNLVIM